ncbi:MAG: hypothetical protein GWN00_04595, partial [Aliifodinibius sp.]|nr:hypothetical protein [Fodinibius sp.]NIV10460.1 hypothetical protein [Fodinibius sp.]NIY24109.1 hypothetical protein [Fodinibius sp.]
LYFHEDGQLNFEKPSLSKEAYDEYISDPSKPVPYTAQITTGMPREYMVEDQR